ncbi:MAG: TRAP transporter large permease subunit, partial [Lachnospiraceae bacterium]|nr:TRAP transporter large permease subunit [Lachnospiraceae bacterium]
IMMGAALAICSVLMSKNMDLQLLPKVSGKERWAAFKDAVWALLMPVIILGGIYGGIFTPTEAAAVSAVYGLVVGVFVYRKMKLGQFITCIINSMAQNGQVLFVMIAAGLFAWMVSVTGMTAAIGNALISISGGNLIVFLLICNVILLLAGCVIDANSALYILVPILLPVAKQLGYDVIAFGLMMCVNLAIGLVTPPVGVNLYTACSIAKISLKDIIKDVLPLIIGLLIVLLLVTYVPQISLLLPNLLKG